MGLACNCLACLTKADGSCFSSFVLCFWREMGAFLVCWRLDECKGAVKAAMDLLTGVLIILAVGFLAGEIAGRLGLPKLIGMLLSGIALGPYVLDLLPQVMLDLSAEIRMLALLVILFKAGLGLDKNKLLAQGTVAVRLSFLPATLEAAVVAVAAHYIFGWDWLTSGLLGWIICAASPAVIVPSMLRLKAEGWGVKKGIPDLILAGGTASDAVAITMFGIFLAWLTGEGSGNPWLQMTDIPVQIILGIMAGIVAGVIVVQLIYKSRVVENVIHQFVIALGMGLILVIGEELVPYSAFLSVMVMGFYILERTPVSARQIRKELDKVWVVGEIFLFVLIGAAVNISVIFSAGLKGLAVIGIALLIGRSLGIFAATWRSFISIKERMFMVVAFMAKATVQAAIGGIPLAMGVGYGEEILAVSVLAILVTAPLGAFGTMHFAPRVLERGKVDPARVSVKDDFTLMVAYDGSQASREAFLEAARSARQKDARIVLANIHQREEKSFTEKELEALAKDLANDLPVKVVARKGTPTKQILELAEECKVDYIYLGKRNYPVYERLLLGDTAQSVVENSTVPVILIAGENNEGTFSPQISGGKQQSKGGY